MLSIPIVILVVATASLGVYLGLRYLRHERNKPIVIGLHILLGAMTLEPMVIAMRGGLGGVPVQPSMFGVLGACGLALALFSGVTAVMIGRRSRQTANVALTCHAAVAASAVLLIGAWALRF
jgi:hypothetical protein